MGSHAFDRRDIHKGISGPPFKSVSTSRPPSSVLNSPAPQFLSAIMAELLFNLHELMSRVLAFATIHSIVALGGTCKLGRDYMQDVLRSLIKAMLVPYFPLHVDRKTLMAVLESTGGVITGSSTLKVILPYERRSSSAPNLNVVVPLGGFGPACTFLRCAGYRGRMLVTSPPLLRTVRACAHYTHPTTGRIVIVAESTRSSVFNVVVKGKYTSSMNMITPRSIYTLYQALTATGYALCGASYSTPLDVLNASTLWGIDARGPNEQLDDDDRICGLECPRRSRKMLGGYGVGQVCWDPSGCETGMERNERMQWKLGDYCSNPGCRDKEPELYCG